MARYVRIVAVFYNGDSGGGRGDELGREVIALAGDPGFLPDDEPAFTFCGICETEGFRPVHVPKTTLTSDRSTASRRNITVYAARWLGKPRTTWFDMHAEWKRTQHPGMHPARSIVRNRYSRLRTFWAHHPPINSNDRAREEHHDALVELLEPWRRYQNKHVQALVKRRLSKVPMLLGWDGNRDDALAAEVGMQRAGSKLDFFLYRNMTCVKVVYRDAANGQVVESDHGHYVEATFLVRAKYLPRAARKRAITRRDR